MEAEALLEGEHLSRRFGGVVAVDDVSLQVRRGEVHAVIGTNGAGKSTLVRMLAGEVAPSAGRVRLQGQDVTGWPQHRRALAGIGRTHQRNELHLGFTAFENCRLAAQAHGPRPWSPWSSADRDAASARAAQEALARVGLADMADRRAGELSHGAQRQLEIASCLAIGPSVLLLDEPLAGMGADETERVLALLATLRADHAILLIEHDMDAVFRLADRLTVMVDGRVIATGPADAVRRDPAVQAAYLGEDGR